MGISNCEAGVVLVPSLGNPVIIFSGLSSPRNIFTESMDEYLPLMEEYGINAPLTS